MLAGTVACSAPDDTDRARVGRRDTNVTATQIHRAAVAPGVGSADPTRRAATVAATGAAADTLLANAEVYTGWRAFNVNCQSCHGFNAVASDVAPDLRRSVGKGGTVTHAQFREVVKSLSPSQ